MYNTSSEGESSSSSSEYEISPKSNNMNNEKSNSAELVKSDVSTPVKKK
jgi:hypothetical protein